MKGAVIGMEENNTNENSEIVSKSDVSSSDKDSKKKKSNKDNNKGSGFFDKHKAEFRKIKWPSRQELFKETVVVIIISLLVGVIIFGMDTVFQFGFDKINDLLKTLL